MSIEKSIVHLSCLINVKYDDGLWVSTNSRDKEEKAFLTYNAAVAYQKSKINEYFANDMEDAELFHNKA